MAEKPESPLLEKIGDSVTCPVCLKYFEDARALPCHHTYCKECLQELLDRGNIKCPECRKEFPIPNGDVSNLSPNYIANSAVDALRLKPDAPARETDRTNAMVMQPIYCKRHPEKECEYFCTHCYNFICFACTKAWDCLCSWIYQYQPINEAAETVREQVHSQLLKRKEQLQSVSKNTTALREMKAKETKQANEVSKQISNAFEKQIKCLKRRQDVLQTQVVEVQKQNIAAISAEMDQLRSEQAKVENSIVDGQATLHLSDPARFLEKCSQDYDKVFQEISQKMVSHIDLADLHFQAPDAMLTNVISNFGILTTGEAYALGMPATGRGQRSTRRGRSRHNYNQGLR